MILYAVGMKPHAQNGKVVRQVSKKEEKVQPNRRRGLARRLYSYAQHIPERRSGQERRNMVDDLQDHHDNLPDEEIAEQDKPLPHPVKKDAP